MKKAILFFDPKGTIFEVVKLAKREGYVPIAFSSDFDLLETQPVYQEGRDAFAEIYKVNSWQDLNELDTLIAEIGGRLDIVGCYGGMDACALPVGRLRKKLGLPTSEPERIEAVLDKYAMRRTLIEAGLSSLQIYKGQEFEKLEPGEWPFKNVAYFKPTHGSFSAFVSRCDSRAEYEKCFLLWNNLEQSDLPNYLKNYLLQGDYLLEEEIEGELLSVEAISHEGNFKPLGLLSRILYSKNAVVEMGSCFPYPHTRENEIIELVRSAHKVLGITDGPTHTEVIVGKDGKIEIIDFNPRFVGADVLQSINLAYSINIEEALLAYALGQEIYLAAVRKQFSCLQYFLTPEITNLKSVTFPLDSRIQFTNIFKKIGDRVSLGDRQIDYLGCYLTVGLEFGETIAKSFELRSQLRINNDQKGIF